jgi:hypothetical protein
LNPKPRRKKLDQYFTPAWAADVLLEQYPINGSVLECLLRRHSIADRLRTTANVTTNDIDAAMVSDTHFDATTDDYWDSVSGKFDYIVTNPPFSHALPIIAGALRAARCGVAMFLRLSFLEPTEARGGFLSANPPRQLLVLPRISFTGDGKTDSTTTAWFIWDDAVECKIRTIPKETHPKWSKLVRPNSNADRQRKYRYDISPEDFALMLESQGGVCAVCQSPEASSVSGKTKALSVDHCHVSGRVRALLCDRCNRSLGAVDDNVQLLESLINYLRTHVSKSDAERSVSSRDWNQDYVEWLNPNMR